ncbi:hypothetical protein FJU30_14485 [Affinibrenneria salicis]|uniref:HIT family protein n=1 Tax=Affinibrenneria salicis TaxID=2590031 RepID=A0A5J5FXR2_9GAMM|nr:hypothetical protein [Affinibrenneria salicis]KAA8998892.1 hypothetical protein FJU30_14485 [Affinibrenneria salicis]
MNQRADDDQPQRPAAQDGDVIFATDYWQVNLRRDARYPGYLMISSRSAATEISQLDAAALSGLGGVMKRVEQLLLQFCRPDKVMFWKLGFSPGFSLHFHAAPVTPELLREIAAHPDYPAEPDGNDVILYLSRIYCERPLSASEMARREQTRAQLTTLAARQAVD